MLFMRWLYVVMLVMMWLYVVMLVMRYFDKTKQAGTDFSQNLANLAHQRKNADLITFKMRQYQAERNRKIFTAWQLLNLKCLHCNG